MKMLQQFHLASQYLAMAGKSFLEHLEDDSHTNMGFSTTEKSLLTWPLDDSGTQLGLNYTTFALDWKSGNPQSFSLEGKTHQEVLDWLHSMAQGTNFSKPYEYQLHYGLPYAMDELKTYYWHSKDEVEELVRLRTLAQNVLSTFLQEEALESEIRVWPHHFDTGAFAHLHDGSGKSIGLGLAIPDNMVDDFYFYISGYRGNTSLRTWAFPPLSHGKWHNNGFKGAILPASNVTEEIGLQFFREALLAYKK
ncbi:hypothetical protein J0X14_10195 [Muricauda sp. CAU 1633]|uniref:hypothetical protein n=1 Tax=Allomuricauda sp. CAU 1633 TaxID=2816036 RepID=UPI001A8FD51E|nr:hypothetical protein [Muricauda sp. CAU 1633]MBO0322667.1 hypothetical protein [Muricauda sp. CAU 1633]